MKNKLLIICALLCLLPYTQGQIKESLPNFQQVNPNLYRGAQPPPGGLKILADKGIKTIINLRGASDETRAEEQQAKALGIKFFNLQFPPLSKPDFTQVDQALALINDPANQPVFVHCKHGEDRTGTVIACYRMTHDNWDDEQAITEAKKFGMSFVQVSMKRFIHKFYEQRIKSKKS
jgi:tyrosine-protein phosphatase SIW14